MRIDAFLEQSPIFAVNRAARRFESMTTQLLARLGIAAIDRVNDAVLGGQILCFLQRTQMPFDRLFFDWFGGEAAAPRAQAGPFAKAYGADDFAPIRRAFGERAPTRPDALADAYWRGDGPTTMHIDEVERVWSAIAERDDWQPLEQKLADVRALGRLLGNEPAAG